MVFLFNFEVTKNQYIFCHYTNNKPENQLSKISQDDVLQNALHTMTNCIFSENTRSKTKEENIEISTTLYAHTHQYDKNS